MHLSYGHYTNSRQPTTVTGTTLLLAGLILSCSACDDTSRAQRIVDEAILWQGGAILDNAVVEFDFRNKHFKITQHNGVFSYERSYVDSTGSVREVLNNDEVFREIDSVRVSLAPEKARSLKVDINSVVYFALLPYPLNDEAVIKRYLGEMAIGAKQYDTVEITFTQVGGGDDFEDRFVYWFGRPERSLAYVAYFYHTDGGGSRFREAFNTRVVGGVAFSDYKNFSATVDTVGLRVESFAALKNADAITHVSDVVLHNVSVTPLPDNHD